MVYVFFVRIPCFFLSVLKTTNTLHLYSMCGGIKTLKHNVRTTLQFIYHGCKNLTHTSKTRHVKHIQMVVTVRFTIRVSSFFRLVRIERNKTVAWKDVKLKNQNRRQKVFNRGVKFAQGAWHSQNFRKSWWFIAFYIQISKGWAHQWPPRRLDWFKFQLCCHYWNMHKEIKSYNHRIKLGWT